MLHPFDLANLVTGDHELVETLFQRIESGQGDQQVLFHQVLTNISVHAFAEELTFYKELKERGRPEDAKGNGDEHHTIREALAVIDKHPADSPEAQEAMRTVIAVQRAHAPKEETDELPWLRATIGDDAMLELGRNFMHQEAASPTHPHPHGITSKLVAPVGAMADLVRDKILNRDDEGATDASGLLDDDAQELVDMLAELTPKPPHTLPPKAVRTAPTPADAVTALLTKKKMDSDPEPVASVTDVVLPGAQIPLRVYRPTGSVETDVLPVVLYAHGGGWVIADLDTYDASCRGLANKTGAMVVSVDYRKAPENPFPAAHEDYLAVAAWMLQHAGELGGDASRVALAGESAGGNLAAATAIALRDNKGPQPVFQLLVYPVTSTSNDWPSFKAAADAKPLYTGWLNWFLGHAISSAADLADWRLDLLSLTTEQLAALPPALVITAERDPLHDQGVAYAQSLTTAGVSTQLVQVSGVPHEFFGLAAVVAKAEQAQQTAAAALRTAFAAAT